MKRSAIARIIIYTLLALVLTAILLVGIGIDSFINAPHSGTVVTGEAVIDIGFIDQLDIDWAAGSVTIRTGNTDDIIISESGQFEEKYAMVYDVKGTTLSIDYASSAVITLGSSPSKDLTVTVPSDWFCRDLDIDGAALDIFIEDLNASSVNLDGAALELIYRGSFDTMDCDGASCALDITCESWPTSLDFDGAGCDVELTLPEGCGFYADMEGLGL